MGLEAPDPAAQVCCKSRISGNPLRAFVTRPEKVPGDRGRAGARPAHACPAPRAEAPVPPRRPSLVLRPALAIRCELTEWGHVRAEAFSSSLCRCDRLCAAIQFYDGRR